MTYRATLLLPAFVLLLGVTAARAESPSGPIAVKLVERDGRHQLLRAGRPYFIRGAGGDGSKETLARCGGNSLRTWGVSPQTEAVLDEAHRLGLTVTVGVWLGHKQHGFRYDDPAAVRRQFDEVKQAVLKYKDHPALMMWGLGNEMEVGDESVEMWQAVQQIAEMVHEIDPLHPTMTVIAELGAEGGKARQIHKHCPDIDIIGVNSYGGGPSLAKRYAQTAATKPYVVTEFGPSGAWEVGRSKCGAPLEWTSTRKAQAYRQTYVNSVLGAEGRCLGSYAFIWGSKIEATATWFGMFLPAGERLASVDVMQELWSGEPPAEQCPAISEISLAGEDIVDPGAVVRAAVALEGDGADVAIDWTLEREQATYAAGGLGRQAAPAFPDAVRENGRSQVEVTAPDSGGLYRLYCTVRNGRGGAATGSLAFKVRGPVRLIPAARPKLPLILYADDQHSPPFAPSGWMGDTQAITMQADCKDEPYRGATCLRVRYDKPGDWGGVAWQHPADDWGERPGGYDLSQATRLVFHARGKAGGEKVKFGLGLIGIEKKYHDSCKAELEVTLTERWRRYEIDLAERELIRIKSGFVWSLAGQGRPVEFYLDDIRYE